ncbi:MAG: hypothetical protein JSU04_15940 [Bdellovibrionales bacterium]|nr:hypothetical protein [Bdellovibrionales bacterium]
MSKKGLALTTLMGAMVVMLFVFAQLGRKAVGLNVEGIYKIGECYKNDEFGVTYKVTNTAKGRSFGTVIASEKYPSQEEYKMGAETNWSSVEPFGPMKPVSCPTL